MALVHEKLYQSGDLTQIDFPGYVRDLSAHLYHSYGAGPWTIRLSAPDDGVSPSVAAAIPCAMIINELVSNSLQHAFAPGEKGQIEIHLCARNDGKFTLVVSDNGVGLPENLDFQSTATLGLRLVRTLVNQLKGEIKIDGSGGARFEITFPAQEDAAGHYNGDKRDDGSAHSDR
jgi:two-component sensor histidine kinase